MSDDLLLTQVLGRIDRGDADAARELFPLVYDELRRRAKFAMARERPDHTLQATALVNEAFVKMTAGEPLKFESRAHFYRAAASAMRKILVDHARRKFADKRGGNFERVDLEKIDVAEVRDDIDMEQLDLALSKLQKMDERRYQVVMYRYFSGLEEQQVAELMGVALKTVQRDWKTAKMFLFTEMQRGAAPEAGNA